MIDVMTYIDMSFSVSFRSHVSLSWRTRPSNHKPDKLIVHTLSLSLQFYSYILAHGFLAPPQSGFHWENFSLFNGVLENVAIIFEGNDETNP